MKLKTNALKNAARASVCSSLLFFAGCGKPSPVPVPPATASYNQRLDTYAHVLDSALFGADDPWNTVVRAVSDYPPGTILIGGGNPSALCTVSSTVFLKSDPSVAWSPPVGYDTEFKLGYDLPLGIINGLATAGARASFGSSTALGFDSMTQHMALSQAFETIIADTACKSKISHAWKSGKTVTIVRGSISGKMTFKFNRGMNFGVKAKVTAVGDFDIGLTAGNVAVDMNETKPAVHFLVTYNIPPPNAVPTAVSPPVPSVHAVAPRMKFLPSAEVLKKIQSPVH